jgi:positive regulator of sigma E activity
MTETGIVKEIEGEIAIVIVKPSEQCGTCRMCSCGGRPEQQEVRATTLQGIVPGDVVTVEIDEQARTWAQLWLLALPLAAFLGAALVARLACGAREGVALLVGLAGLAAAFAGVWLADRTCGLSLRPLARISGKSSTTSPESTPP